LIFCSRTTALLTGIQRIQKEFPEIITACWNVDKRDSVGEFGDELLELFNTVDIFYTIAKGNIVGYQMKCPDTQIKHLQEGIDPKLHYPVSMNHQLDVTFAGSYMSKIHHGRKELFEYLQSETPGWNILMRLFGYGNEIYDKAHNDLVSITRVNLSHNGWAQLELSGGLRDYKIMAAGGFLLTEWYPGIDEWFNGTVATYRSKTDCLKKILYYLNDGSAEAQTMADQGMRLVHKSHKVSDRMRVVINDVLSEKKARKGQKVS